MLASQKKFALVALALALGTSACGDRELRPLNPCTISGVQIKVPIENVDKVDLLFMIDNSGSMREEQTSLAMEIPRLVRVLASGMGDGIENFPPVRDLRVGVISSDMGTGGHTVATCSEPNHGDDGILRPTAGCGTSTTPRYLGFRPAEGGDPGQFGTDVACVANLGTSGCGFEQQLDAVLKAVTPSTSERGFVNNTFGHAGGENSDFVRDDSLLAIIMLTDEDDCSASNPDIFNRGSSQFPGDDLNLRCYQYGAPEFNAVYPVQRYVDGLLEVHPSSRLVFGAIVGIPTDLAPARGEATDYTGILNDPRMVEMPSTTDPGLVPSCDITGRGKAYPPRRIIQVAQGLERREVSAVIQSICQESFAGALNAIIAKIADVLNATCLPRALNQDSEGRVTCDIVEVLPIEGDITRCDQLSAQGRVFRETDASGAQVCTICQTDSDRNIIDISPECLALGSNLGWFYQSDEVMLDGCPPERPQRIAFHPGAEPNTGSLIRLECLQTAAAGEGDINIGTGCGGNPTICDTADRMIYPPGLICDAASNTCQMACTSTDFCVDAGLGGYVCFDEDDDGTSLCVNPTCD